MKSFYKIIVDGNVPLYLNNSDSGYILTLDLYRIKLLEIFGKSLNKVLIIIVLLNRYKTIISSTIFNN